MIVVKVGGSLYDHPRLAPGLQSYLASLPEPVFLVPGGGDFADVVRKLDALHNLNKEASHSLALQSMNLAGDFLKRLGITATILDANSITALPHSWNVTSDSIAAQAAIVHQALRLILLKSIDITPGTSWSEAASHGWVDPYFPQLATNAPFTIEVINFRKYLDSLDERG